MVLWMMVILLLTRYMPDRQWVRLLQFTEKYKSGNQARDSPGR